MSTSIVAPTGAVQFNGPNPIEQMHKDALTSVNDSIKNNLINLQNIEKRYADNRELADIKKAEYMSLTSSIADKLKNLNKKNVLSRSFLIDTFKPKLDKISLLIVNLQLDAEGNVSFHN